MRIRNVLMLALGATAAGLVACNSGSSPSGNQVHFGPGSAPNSNSFTGLGGLGGGIGAFQTVAPLNTARQAHTTTLLRDGRVLVVGGSFADSMTPLDTAAAMHIDAEVYDSVMNMWTPVSQLASNQANPNNGRLMDPTDMFPTGRVHHTAVVTNTGGVVIAGGLGFDRMVGTTLPVEPLATAYVFDPGSDTFNRVQAMPIPRYFHLAHLVVDGNVLHTQGYELYQALTMSSLTSADLYNPSVGTWSSVGGTVGTNATTGGHTWGNIAQFGQRVLVGFGMAADNFSSQGGNVIGVDRIAPGVFFPVQQSSGLPPGFFLPGQTGGATAGGFPGTTVEFYDAQLGMFQTGPNSLRRTFPSGVILGGGTTLSAIGDIFFAGGEDLGPQRDDRLPPIGGPIRTTEILRRQSQQFEAGPDMGEVPGSNPLQFYADAERTEVECIEIGSTGDVLIIGGTDRQGAVSQFCQVWSYQNNLILHGPAPMPGGTPTDPQMAQGRIDFGAVKINGDQIIVVGGQDDQNNPLDSVELWSR